MVRLHCLLALYFTVDPQRWLTVNQHTVGERVHGPDIWRPVGVTESSREWEQPLEHLRDLLVVHERTESETRDDCNA